jgi:hypothetical protein
MTMMLKTGVAHGLPKFSALEYRHVGPDAWQLTRTFLYFGNGYVIVVPFGFITDLDSIPRVPFMYALLKGRSVRAATVHDYLYNTQAGKAYADSVFLAAMKDEGLPKRRRYPIYWAVALFGGPSYNQHAESK